MTDAWVEEKQLKIIDRSDLELYVVCPRQAVLMASGEILNASAEMDSGNAVHDALGEVTAEYVASQWAMNQREVQELLDAYLLQSRPDVQSDAIDAMQFAKYSWARFLTDRHYQKILRHDGGDGKWSGQIAYDFDDLGIRVTSEIDLLYAGPSPEVIHEIDYKTGHTFWSMTDVAESFQFQFHALLLFAEYENIQAVEIRVWNTRRNNLTYPVIFDRKKHFDKILYRVRAAAEKYVRSQGKAAADVEAWPGVEKCSLCRAASRCMDSKHVGDIAASPEAYLAETIALQANLDARYEALKGQVKQTGKDIVLSNGDSFGFNKPKTTRKPTAAIYSTKGSEEAE